MSATAGSTPGKPAADAAVETQTPFRFYDNRQKYLAFINTCNEKAVVARRAAREMQLQAVLQKHGGLWFNDEAFVVSRRT